ncbi:hypothetical protein AC26_0260 [Escherichia coli 1-176-05_S3_C2]|nr:hypothetical protein AC26_0260 [Escherichia coli 1-176-05_S3_C2]
MIFCIEKKHKKDTNRYITLRSVICIIVSFWNFDDSIN